MKKLLAVALASFTSLAAFGQHDGTAVRRGSNDGGVREAIREHRVRGEWHHRTARGDHRYPHRHHTPRHHAPRYYHHPVYPSYTFAPRDPFYTPRHYGPVWHDSPRYTVGYHRPYGHGWHGSYHASYPVRGDATSTGALLGAGLGAIIGHNDGRRGVEGALIGGFIGALLGASVDEANARPAPRRMIEPSRASVYDPNPAYGFVTSMANHDAPPAPATVRYSAPVPEQREFRRPAIAVSRASYTSR